MDHHSIPEKPLTAGIDPKVYPPQKTFFYERPNGSVVCVEEKEAWTLHKKFKQVGVSDGTTFQAALMEAKRIFQEQGLEAAQARLRQGHEEELEKARGHFQAPRNFDTVGFNGQPVNINDLR